MRRKVLVNCIDNHINIVSEEGTRILFFLILALNIRGKCGRRLKHDLNADALSIQWHLRVRLHTRRKGLRIHNIGDVARTEAHLIHFRVRLTTARGLRNSERIDGGLRATCTRREATRCNDGDGDADADAEMHRSNWKRRV